MKLTLEEKATISEAAKILTDSRVLQIPLPETSKKRTLKVLPAKVGTMYRLASFGVMIEQYALGSDKSGFDLYLENYDTISNCAAILIKNKSKLPSSGFVMEVGDNIDAFDLHIIVSNSLDGSKINQIKDFYHLHDLDDNRKFHVPLRKSRKDSLPQTAFANICKHYKWDYQNTLWKMSWDNFILSLTQPDKDDEAKPIEIKDSDDLF